MLPSSTTVRSLLVGQVIELRRLSGLKILSREPTTIEVEKDGFAVLFRFGVVVLFNVSGAAESGLLARLKPLIQEPFDYPVVEPLISPTHHIYLDTRGLIHQCIERLAVCAL